MSIKNSELKKFLTKLLRPYDFQDYGPNGLQVEGNAEIRRIAYAVSATKESIEQACALKADALIVHHGLFWKFHGPKTITGSFAKRIRPLIENNINLYGYHLPLDANMEVGNAASIAEKIDLASLKPFGDYKGSPTGVQGKFEKKISIKELQEKLASLLNHSIICSAEDDSQKVSSMGIITGGANSDWRKCVQEGLECYLTGEISEHDWHEAREEGIHFFAGGHNATESLGIQSLLARTSKEFSSLEHFYIPSINPA